jgi:hypothetical protein
MKYGAFFSTLSLLSAFQAFTSGGWFLLLAWPAISFGAIGLAYLTLGHRVFGKRSDGSMTFASVAILLPYLLYLWVVWHLIRLVSREPAYNTLVDGVLIGRRLLSSEIPVATQTVVDLTSEFPEPVALRSVSNYVAAPMLDASVLPPQSLANLASRIAMADTPVYIHCAQGHGRTGLVAALLLLARGDAENPDAAMQMIQSSRPLVGLNGVQRVCLVEAAKLIQSSAV